MSTYNPTKKELTFIKKNFETVEYFCTYCSDYLALIKKDEFFDEDCVCFESFTNGKTTGIVLDAFFDEEEDKFYLTVLAEGEIHFAEADSKTDTIILSFIEQLFDDPGEWNHEEIENLDFLKKKPFILEIKNGFVDLIRPLDPNLYSEALKLANHFLEKDYIEFKN